MVLIPELPQLSSACGAASAQQAAVSSATQLENNLNRTVPLEFLSLTATETGWLSRKESLQDRTSPNVLRHPSA
jgi:hypothetical protein